MPALIMGHLISKAGHLMARGAHLANDSNGTDCCCGSSPNCPTDVSACPTAYALTLANFINGAGGLFCCAALNNSYPGNPATWNLTIGGGNGLLSCPWGLSVLGVTCPIGTTDIHFCLFCDKHDCSGAAAAKRWVITCSGSLSFRAEQISNANCPPLGAYTLCAGGCTDNGILAATVTLS